jgi:hypothetical protein
VSGLAICDFLALFLGQVGESATRFGCSDDVASKKWDQLWRIVQRVATAKPVASIPNPEINKSQFSAKLFLLPIATNTSHALAWTSLPSYPALQQQARVFFPVRSHQIV